jgi:hypothetical protein
MNLPEALDYLSAASRFRNDSIAQYNSAMGREASRITDAQRYLDTGETVFKDVEKLVLDNVPKIRTEYEGMKNVLADYRAGFEQNLPLLISKQKADKFVLGNEQIMQTAFKSAENLRQLQVALGGSPRFEELLTTGTMDWLRRNNIMKDGLVDGNKLKGLLDKNRNIVEALPPSIQQKLTNEQTLADDYVRRMGELDQRKVMYQDAELDNLLAKSARPDADPREAVRAAIKDPAMMRKLMDVMGKDPDQLAALRRSVYDFATEGTQKGGALAGFLENNKPSLSLLFKDTGHLADLQKLADIQRRVSLLQDVTGRLPAFEATDEAMQKTFGFGIRWLTTTYRDAAMGRVSPTTGVMAFLIRMTSALENKMYKRLFTKALEDREFAKSISNISTPEDGRQVAQKISEIGIIPRLTVFSAPRAMTQEATQQVAPERPVSNLPTVPRETQEGTARQMLRALPPAPPTRGFNFRMPTGTPGQQNQQRPAPPPGLPDISQQYQTMFPRDMLSDMLKSRVAPPQQ